MPVVFDIDGAAELGHPESNSVVGELQQDALELGPRERPLWFRDDECVPAPVRIPQVVKDSEGFWAPLPRQASALVDVMIRGDDLTVRRDEPSRRVRLPTKAVCRVLKIVGRGARTRARNGSCRLLPQLHPQSTDNASEGRGGFPVHLGLVDRDEIHWPRSVCRRSSTLSKTTSGL